MRLPAALLTLLLITGCAHQPGAGSYADAGSTYAALSSSGFTEANPVIATGDPLTTALVSIGAKQALKYGLTAAGTPGSAPQSGAEPTSKSAVGWNIALMAGAGPPGAIVAAVIAGTAYYRITDCQET